MRSLLLSWLARGGVAAFLLALLETALVLDRTAYLRGELFATACLFLCLFAAFAFWSTWLAMILALAEQKKRVWLTVDAPLLYSALTGIAFTAYVLVSFRGQLERYGFDQPHVVRDLELWADVAILVLAVGVARFVLLPAFMFLARTAPIIFASERLARVLGCLAAMAIAVHAASKGFEPLYLSPLAGIAGVFALFALLIALRQVWPVPSATLSARVMPVFLALIAIVPFTASRQPSAAFALHSSAFIAAPLVRLLETSADFDGDGTHSVLLGGSDCEEFNAARGGGLAEIPGDGIDQDCRGGDATPIAARTFDVELFPGCQLPAEKLSILFITIESFRADRFAKRRSPNLWGYAEHGVYYAHAYSPATTTSAAFPAIFTGTPASKLGSKNLNLDLRFRLTDHLSAQLDRAGFDSAAYSALSQPGGSMVGFADRFPWYRDSVPAPLGTKGLFNSAMVSMNAMNYLRIARDPFFLWIHYADLQAPHLNPQLNAKRFRDAPNYDLEVSYTDSHVGRLLQFLANTPLVANTTVFVMGTQGEDLGDRGRLGHGRDVFEDSSHVPLIVKIPGCPPRIELEPVSLVQLAPTISLLTGTPRHGVPLFPAITSSAAPQALVVSEGIGPNYFNRAVVRGRYKLIEDEQNAGRLLFDLQADPNEEHNLYEEKSDVARELEAALQQWLDTPAKAVVARLRGAKE